MAEDVIREHASDGPRSIEPVWMDPKDSEALTKHYELWFGVPSNILFHERHSEGVHLDTLIFSPTDDRPFITIATAGMSTLPIACDSEGKHLIRAELLAYLPSDWDFGGSVGFMPMILLNYVARFPHLEHAQFSVGDSFEAPVRPIAEGSLLTDLYIRNPVLENLDLTAESAEESRAAMAKFAHVDLPSGDCCHLFWVIPITMAECYIKQSQGAHALDLILTDNSEFILDIDRPCFVAPENRAQRRARQKAQRVRSKNPPLNSIYDLERMVISHGQHSHERAPD